MSVAGRVQLGEVAEFINGFAFKPEDWVEEGHRIIRIQNLNDSTKPFNRTKREVDEKYHVQPGDLLVSWSASLGVFTWQNDDVALLNQHIFRVVPNQSRVDKNYLRHMLQDALDEMSKHLHGATMKHVNRKEFLSTTIPLPPLAEQKRIAGILDAADALRAKRRESIEQLDKLIQSTFLEMFGDPVTNPKGWDKRTIGDCVESIDSGWSPKCLDRPAGESEWGVLKLGSVTWCMFDESQQKALPKHDSPRPHLEVKNGDLLFSRKNTHDLVAAAAYVNSVRPKLMLPDLVFRLRLKADSGIDPIFLWAQLTEPRQRKSIQRLAGGAAGSMPNISKARLSTVEIIAPATSKQRSFVSAVKSVDAARSSMQTHLYNLDTLFASLQSRAFRGEL